MIFNALPRVTIIFFKKVLILTFWLCRTLKMSFSNIAYWYLLRHKPCQAWFQKTFSIYSRFFCFLLVRFLEIDASQSPKFSLCLSSPLLKIVHFSKKIFWVFKKPFFKMFLLLETISHKNSETLTPCPLIQCWLQVCLVISGHHCLT